jgi:signal transduction histidine kinase
VAVLGAAALVGIGVSRRLNRPIDELRRWAADPDRDPPEATGIAELDSLRSDLIAGRERIAELLRRERSFSSHVSHQLRTPVAALRVAVETELTAPRDDPSELLRESLGQLDRLESTITGLLALARHDTRPDDRVELLRLVRERVAAHPAARSVLVTGHTVSLVTDAVAVEHIVDVLVDNAARHGRGGVLVTVDAAGRTATIDVGDEGPTPDPAAIFADRASDAGHGIGLRLARTLAESIGGELTLLARPTTTFRVSLPIADHGRPTVDHP